MRKKLAVLMLTLGIGSGLFSSPSVNAASYKNDSPYEINVNGSFIPMDAQPVAAGSTLLIPIRTLSSLGLTYVWDAPAHTVTITNEAGDMLTVTLGSRTAAKNGETLTLSVPAQAEKGRVLVPIRFISESLGYKVQYESIRKMIFVTSADYSFDTGALEQDDLVAARLAALSLPVTADSKTLAFGTRIQHSYRFPTGKADTYVFGDGYTNTIVKIEDGHAIALGQYVEGDRSNFAYTAGGITESNSADPLLEPFRFGVAFSRNINAKTTLVIYWIGNQDSETRDIRSFTADYTDYSDLVQEVPDHR